VGRTASDERYGTLSPDGQWLAYISNETGVYELYVRTFRGTGPIRQVSTGTGWQPVWRQNGRELFFLGPDRALMSAPFVSGRGTLSAGPPALLFPTRTRWIEIQAAAHAYAAAPDGQRFLLIHASRDANGGDYADAQLAGRIALASPPAKMEIRSFATGPPGLPRWFEQRSADRTGVGRSGVQPMGCGSERRPDLCAQSSWRGIRLHC
jgi:hypothetical protein